MSSRNKTFKQVKDFVAEGRVENLPLVATRLGGSWCLYSVVAGKLSQLIHEHAEPQDRHDGVEQEVLTGQLRAAARGVEGDESVHRDRQADSQDRHVQIAPEHRYTEESSAQRDASSEEDCRVESRVGILRWQPQSFDAVQDGDHARRDSDGADDNHEGIHFYSAFQRTSGDLG